MEIALGSIALEILGGAAAGWVIWRRRVNRTTPPNSALEPMPPVAAPAIVVPPEPVAAFPEIEDAQEVVPTAMTLVWARMGSPPEHYEVRVDRVSGDSIVFSGEARLLDAAPGPAKRELFHTLDLPQERLLLAHDENDAPIEDVRAWLKALPRR